MYFSLSGMGINSHLLSHCTICSHGTTRWLTVLFLVLWSCFAASILECITYILLLSKHLPSPSIPICLFLSQDTITNMFTKTTDTHIRIWILLLGRLWSMAATSMTPIYWVMGGRRCVLFWGRSMLVHCMWHRGCGLGSAMSLWYLKGHVLSECLPWGKSSAQYCDCWGQQSCQG